MQRKMKFIKVCIYLIVVSYITFLHAFSSDSDTILETIFDNIGNAQQFINAEFCKYASC